SDSPHFDCDEVCTAVCAHRANKARLDNIESVRAHLTPAATAPESVAGQLQLEMRSAGVARHPRRFASYWMQNGGRGTNCVGENAEGVFILFQSVGPPGGGGDAENRHGSIV